MKLASISTNLHPVPDSNLTLESGLRSFDEDMCINSAYKTSKQITSVFIVLSIFLLRESSNVPPS